MASVGVLLLLFTAISSAASQSRQDDDPSSHPTLGVDPPAAAQPQQHPDGTAGDSIEATAAAESMGWMLQLCGAAAAGCGGVCWLWRLHYRYRREEW
eukprot:COSAG01_NODE_6344_length_3723_cov_68.518212_5_plen_97_part_00